MIELTFGIAFTRVLPLNSIGEIQTAGDCEAKQRPIQRLLLRSHPASLRGRVVVLVRRKPTCFRQEIQHSQIFYKKLRAISMKTIN